MSNQYKSSRKRKWFNRNPSYVLTCVVQPYLDLHISCRIPYFAGKSNNGHPMYGWNRLSPSLLHKQKEVVESDGFWRWCISLRITGLLLCRSSRILNAKGLNRVGVSLPLTWGRKRIQFPKRRIFYYLEFRTIHKVQKPSDSEKEVDLFWLCDEFSYISQAVSRIHGTERSNKWEWSSISGSRSRPCSFRSVS
jgi:hypothetical protein